MYTHDSNHSYRPKAGREERGAPGGAAKSCAFLQHLATSYPGRARAGALTGRYLNKVPTKHSCIAKHLLTTESLFTDAAFLACMSEAWRSRKDIDSKHLRGGRSTGSLSCCCFLCFDHLASGGVTDWFDIFLTCKHPQCTIRREEKTLQTASICSSGSTSSFALCLITATCKRNDITEISF
jgi:hypothetical protein